ncbi:MAG: outer membrane protein assembly factor, partial [Bacteroidales bacterium]|nr:outer membrane protein assembly factor [Bacteroidales bacterium]
MIILILLPLLFACNPVKHVPTGEHLLRSTKIVTADDGLSNREMRNYIKQHPNRKIFVVARLYLGIYNLSNPEKNNGFNNWLRKIGEEPVVQIG